MHIPLEPVLQLVAFVLAVLVCSVVGAGINTGLGRLRQRFGDRNITLAQTLGAYVIILYALNHRGEEIGAFHVPPLGVFLEVTLLVMVAASLFYLKISRLTEYAIIEFLFAVLLGWQAASEQQGQYTIDGPQGLRLLAAVYLMVRAFDNFKKGWDGRQQTPS